MCWSNSLPSSCTTIPGASAAAQGRPSSGPRAPTEQAAEELPLAAHCGGQQMVKRQVRATWKECFSSQSNVYEKMSHTHLIPTEMCFFSTREMAQPNFPPHSGWEHHIKSELYDNLVTIMSGINYTFPSASNNPCDVARPRSAQYR